MSSKKLGIRSRETGKAVRSCSRVSQDATTTKKNKKRKPSRDGIWHEDKCRVIERHMVDCQVSAPVAAAAASSIQIFRSLSFLFRMLRILTNSLCLTNSLGRPPPFFHFAILDHLLLFSYENHSLTGLGHTKSWQSYCANRYGWNVGVHHPMSVNCRPSPSHSSRRHIWYTTCSIYIHTHTHIDRASEKDLTRWQLMNET